MRFSPFSPAYLFISSSSSPLPTIIKLSPPEKVVFLISILAYAAILGDTRQKSDPVKIFSKIIAMQPNAPLRGLKRANIGL